MKNRAIQGLLGVAVWGVSVMAGAAQVKLAVASVDQAFMDAPESVRRACSAATEAARNGAGLVVFSEAFVGGGYPYWNYINPMLDFKTHSTNYAAYVNAAVSRDGKEMQELSNCAKKNNIAMVVPFTERGQGVEIKNAYNAAALIERDGKIKSIQRKIQASHNERFYWMTPADPNIEVVELAGIRVAYNACWQNYYPAVRHAQYLQGAELMVASTQDFGPKWERLMQTIADEGNVYVASVTQMYPWADIAKKDPKLEKDAKALFGQLFGTVPPKLQSGDGFVVAPGGDVIVKAPPFESKIVYADLDTTKNLQAAAYRDVASNYRLPLQVIFNGKTITPDR